jgi:hypothetical protein
MLRFEELEQNPVSIALRGPYGAVQRDNRGEVVTVLAERLRKGAVKLTCRCPDYSEFKWCRHCLTLFADPEIFADAAHWEAFQKIVQGTLVEAAAARLIKALDAFSVAYRGMKHCLPTAIEIEQLTAFSSRADDASQHADGLVEAIAEFVKKASADTNARGKKAHHLGAIFSEFKSAFSDVRKSLKELMTEPLLNTNNKRAQRSE